MERHEVEAILGRERTCKSVDRAMAVLAQGFELVTVWEDGSEESLARAKREYPDARLVILAKGQTPFSDRIGVFQAQGYVAPRLF